MFIVPISQMPSLSAEPLQQTQKIAGSKVPFADVLADAVQNMQETQAVAQADSYRLAMGEADDLHTIMINSAKATTAMEFTVELTTRAVSAYNEILRMQV